MLKWNVKQWNQTFCLKYLLYWFENVYTGGMDDLLLFSKWGIFQLYHGENKLHFDVSFVLGQHA